MKIFIGLNNVASVFSDLKAGFSELGIETLIVSRYMNSSVIINDYSDFNTALIKAKLPNFRPKLLSSLMRRIWSWVVDSFIFRKAVKECDTFIFISSSFREDFCDLRRLKSKGKHIICVFVGDDVRWIPAMEQEFRKYNLDPIEYDIPELLSFKYLKERLTRIRKSEKHADFIFSRLDQAQLQLRPYYRWNMMVDPKKISVNSTQRKIPIIAHAPSDRSFKGTKYVLSAFDELKKEGLMFDIRLIENIPNKKALELYADADIVIDQLLCPGAGKLATEALASGAIVMSNMSYKSYPQNNLIDCPIIDVNPANIQSVLKKWILNVDKRIQLASLSRVYAEKHLDIRNFCDQVVRLVNGDNIPYDYYPSFFHEHYIPNSKTERDILNHWTLAVKDEKWFKQSINNKERSGLRF